MKGPQCLIISFYSKDRSTFNEIVIFFKLGFTPCKAEQLLQGMDLQRKKKHKKDYRIQKICLEISYS